MSMHGWVWIDSFGNVDTYRHAEYGMVSVDTKNRIATIGGCVPRGHNSLFPGAEYKGRNWESRLLKDAFAEAKRRWEEAP